MKKFFVGLLSLFMICGGFLLASCGERNVNLTLSDTYKEIVVLDEEVVEPAIVTCKVEGVDNGRVLVSSSQPNIVMASVEYSQARNENVITLTAGDTEGRATVNVTTYDGGVSKAISVYVHGEVTAMEEKKELGGKSNLFAVRGGDGEVYSNTLDAQKLLDFTTTLNSKRTDVTWQIAEEDKNENISLEGNVLSIGSAYKKDIPSAKVALIATSVYNPSITAKVELTLLDKISSNLVNLAFSYNPTQNFNPIFTTQNGELVSQTIDLTSNASAKDGRKSGYIKFTPSGNFDASNYQISPVISYQGSNTDNGQISILQNSILADGSLLFKVEGKDKANVTVSACFNIGYEDFNYIEKTMSFKVSSYEKIDTIRVSDGQDIEVVNKQTIYNFYSKENNLGQVYNIALLPNTVIENEDKTQYKYKLAIDFSQAEFVGSLNKDFDENTLVISYLDPSNNIITLGKGDYEVDGDSFVLKDEKAINATRLYIKANERQSVSAIRNVRLSFISVANSNVVTDLTFDLQQAAENLVFENQEKNNVYLSTDAMAISTENRRFKLNGQSTIEGLSVLVDNKFVTASNIRQTNSNLNSFNDENPWVEFEVDFTLTPEGKGQTRQGSYTIVHKNGISSQEFELNVLLPLTNAAISIDSLAAYNSVVGYKTNGSLYDGNGNEIVGSAKALNFLMIKSGNSLPFNVVTNSVAGVSSEASLDFRFVGEKDQNGDPIEFDFANLQKYFNNESLKTNDIVSVNLNTKTLSVNSVGTAYMIVRFVGKSLTGSSEAEVVFYRVIKIESFFAPATLAANISSVKVYTQVSVNDDADTTADIVVNFAQNNITYSDLKYFTFNGEHLAADSHEITLAGGIYKLENINLSSSKSYLSFTIKGLKLDGQALFNDTLKIGYNYSDNDKNAVLALETTINVSILNADRIEKVYLESHNTTDGIYFEIGDASQEIIVTSTSPTNAKNKNLTFFVTNNLDVQDDFISISPVSEGSDVATFRATKGKSGFIYILPTDAINNGRISFYEKNNPQIQSILLSELGKQYERLIENENAYFKNNSNKEVPFSDILIKIPVTVADGQGFETAYRVYSASQFKALDSTKFYTIMNNIEVTDFAGHQSFTGGLQGIREDVTIVLKGRNFANTNLGTIKNITFAGEVVGNGFVADINAGTISNVTIDVYAIGADYTYSSITGSEVGGIVGINQNDAIIENSSVLGLNIKGSSMAAGVAAQNAGKISGCRVEFYNFSDGQDAANQPKSKTNKFTASKVAGLVGVNSGAIEKSYAYDYTKSEVLVGDAKALVYTNAGSINLSFASVGADLGSVTLTNGYVVTRDAGGNETIAYYPADITGNENFVSSGEEGFLSYVNGGDAHLKEVYQPQEATLTGLQVKTVENAGFYKTLAASQDEVLGNFYEVQEDISDKDRESRELKAYNTITLSQLFGIDDFSGLVATTSNAYVAQVLANELIFTGVGDAEITIYSKQDYTAKKTIKVKVVYALSKLVASSNTVEIEDGGVVSLLKGKTRSITYNFDKTSLRLGSSAQTYNLTQNNFKLTSSAYNFTSPLVLNVNENNIVQGKNVSVTPTILTDAKYESFQKAANSEFGHSFLLTTFEGGIDLVKTEDKIAITPSTTGKLTALLRTSNQNDILFPKMSLDGINLEITKVSEGVYTAAFGDEQRFNITLTKKDNVTSLPNGIVEIEFIVEISVHESYKWNVTRAATYKVSLHSDSEIVSTDFEAALTPQRFNHVDVNSYKLSSMTYEKVEGFDSYKTVYTVEGTPSSVLAPGYGSVLKININPEFANYHSMKLSYQGATTANAVVLRKVLASTETKFYDDGNANIETSQNNVTIIPSAQDKSKGAIYFYLWINQSVNVDTNLTFDITFYDANGNLIEGASVKHFLKVAYLQDPEIVINGQRQLSFTAKGEQVTGKLYFDSDQTVTASPIKLSDAVKGIKITNQQEVPSDIAGRRLVTFTLSIDVNAQVSGGNNAFKINAEVFGEGQIKTATNTVTVVDLAIDTDPSSIKIFSSYDNIVKSYIGLDTPLAFEYAFMPEEYNYDMSSEELNNAVAQLNAARTSFASNGYHKELLADKTAYYSINYDRTHVEQIPLKERVDYFNEETGGWSNIYIKETGEFVSSINGIFSIKESGNNLVVTGLKETPETTTVRMRMTTYINYGGLTLPVIKEFGVSVKQYSDEDLPICVEDETDFLAMAEGDARDYILMKDIYLKNYRPIDTDKILSLDGNGHTIHIESFNTEKEQGQNTLSLALFKNVASTTTIKNVTVNLFGGGRQILADISDYSMFEIAGFAISNSGNITNSSVVAFGSNTNASTSYGLNITYINGSGTTMPIYLNASSNWNSNVAGFALRNSGSITNSRVGGDNVYVIGGKIDDDSDAYYQMNSISLLTFNIKGQGNMAGFVLENTGSIASSYAKNIDMANQSEDPTCWTSGFVGTNSRTIITSYVEGVKSEEVKQYAYCRRGSSIKSKVGVVSGFVYENLDGGTIKDNYSNISIANSNLDEQVYLASGFVYINRGSLVNCYSTSQIQNLKYSQMNFSGVDAGGNLKTLEGSYENCYYYNPEYTDFTDNSEPTESSFVTGAGQLKDVTNASSFYGFAVGTEYDEDTIWKMSKKEGLKLNEPDLLTFSHRYYKPLSNATGTQTYTLPYATVSLGGNLIDVQYGSKYNPILIRSAQEFVDVTGKSKSSNITEYFDEQSVNGSYRLIANIDFNDLNASGDEQTGGVDIPSSVKVFTGQFYGNGFTISNLNNTKTQKRMAFGLFASIEQSRKDIRPMVLNLNLTVANLVNNQAAAVGSLAGYMRDASVVNVNVEFAQNAKVEGLNFVGGIVGFALGDSKLKNLTITNATVISTKQLAAGYVDSPTDVLNTDTLAVLRANLLPLSTSLTSNMGATIGSYIDIVGRYSYAGGIVGFADIFTKEQSTQKYYSNNDFTAAEDDSKFSLTNLHAFGDTHIQGSVAGGVIGLSGSNSAVRDAKLVIDGTMSNNSTHIISTKYYAGGVIGQAFGTLSQIVATHNEELQHKIQSNMGGYYQSNAFDVGRERGAIDIFSATSGNYTQMAIGGLVGYVGSGLMKLSYSNINAIGLTSYLSGGIVGIANIPQKVESYSVNTGALKGFDTKYLVNQVYAAGDVRAYQKLTIGGIEHNPAAGGIFGQITNGSQISLYAVNSVNFISFYDYTQNANAQDISSFYSSNNISAFVGDLKGNPTLAAGDVLAQLKPYVSLLIQTTALTDSEGKPTTQTSSTVARIYRYATAGEQASKQDIAPDFAPGIKMGTVAGNTSAYIPDASIAKIEEPALYTEQISVGRNKTQAAFLNNDYWINENWTHPTSELFPTLKYTDAIGYIIYLDNYRIEQTLRRMMANTTAEVIIRGKNSDADDDTNYTDIDLREVLAKREFQNGLTSFAGTLHGMEQYRKDGGEGEYPNIILDRPLFSSTLSGFTIRDAIFKFDFDETIQGDNASIFTTGAARYSGGLVDSDLTNATLTNVTFKVVRPGINLRPNENNAVGIIAPSITGTNITGTKIVITEDGNGSQFASGTSVLTVSYNSEIENEEIKAGLFAGEAKQNSNIRQMTFNGNTIESTIKNDINIISINANNSTNRYKKIALGAIFGSAVLSDGNMTVALLGAKTNKALGFNVAAPLEANSLLVVGGLIGHIDASVDLSFNDNVQGMNSTLTVKSCEGDMTYGGIVGKICNNGDTSSAGSTMSFASGSEDETIPEIKTKFDFNDEKVANSITYGGIVGYSINALSISDLKTFNAINEVSKADFFKSGSERSINFSYSKPQPLKANTINYGGLVGKAVNNVKISSSQTNQVSFSAAGENSLNFVALQATNINAGGLVGDASSVNIDKAYIVADNFYISSPAPSSTRDATATATANVGGFVGSAGSVNIQNGDNNVSRYDGHILLNYSSAINVGGFVGGVKTVAANTDTTLTNATLNNISFGGTIRIGSTCGGTGNTSSINVGGTAGYLKVANISVQQNYNYGDVYIAQEKGLLGDGYYFGGILGKTYTEALVSSTVTGNYSLVTHNSYKTTKDTQNVNIKALFGSAPTKDQAGGTVSKNNFYNHGVVLATDAYGTDMGYCAAYNDDDGKYGFGEYDKTQSICEKIKEGVGESDQTLNKGHKLNPDELKLQLDVKDNYPDNGVYYYVAPSTSKGMPKEYTQPSNQQKTQTIIKNIAIIGDGNSIKLKDLTKNFIDSMQGYSYISSLVVELENMVVGEGTNTTTTSTGTTAASDLSVGGLVGKMEGGNIFAVGLSGNIEVAGQRLVNVGGLVGEMTSGTISDSYSVADIIYRAKAEGHMGGIVGKGIAATQNTDTQNTVTQNTAFIYGTFSGGSLESYIDTNIHAFAGGEKISINNSYTFSYINWNDHTSGKTTPDSDRLDVWGDNTNLVQAYYDSSAVNLAYNTKNKSDYSSLRASGLGENWNADEYYAYNFGYPTRKGFDYLRPSSLYQIVEEDKTTIGEEGKTIPYNTKKDLAEGQEGNKASNANIYTFKYKRLSVYETEKNIKTKSIQTASTGEASSTTKYAYGIPNAMGLHILSKKYLENLSNISIVFLLNDINFANTSKSEDDYNMDTKATGMIELPSSATIFDGNGHTIEELSSIKFTKGVKGTRALFNNLTDKKVFNLRITNDNATVMTSPLLVDTLNNTEVANLTLSGRIVNTNANNNNWGAVARQTDKNNSTLTAVTNMVGILQQSSGGIDVGGLVGHVQTGGELTINYSSNYGTIEVMNAQGTDMSVGGLVGYTQAQLTIYNSYNANSVINGYRGSPNALSKTSANYQAGGLVGHADANLNIKNSYNSGIVKAGNKSVAGGDVSSAGGIVGLGSGKATVTISNCYNEGSIEALGKDPTFITKAQTENLGEDSIDDSEKEIMQGYTNYTVNNIELYQAASDNANVNAYSIGYFKNRASDISKTNSSAQSINANGTLNLKHMGWAAPISIEDAWGNYYRTGYLLSTVNVEGQLLALGRVGEEGETSGDGSVVSSEYNAFRYRLTGFTVENKKAFSSSDLETDPAGNQDKDEDYRIVEQYGRSSEYEYRQDSLVISYGNCKSPISVLYRVPYQLLLYVYSHKNDNAGHRQIWHHRQMYANDQLVQANFLDDENYKGYEEINAEYNFAYIEEKGQQSSEEKSISKESTSYYTNSENKTTTINGNPFVLVGNNADAEKYFTAGNMTLNFDVKLNFEPKSKPQDFSINNLTLDSLKLNNSGTEVQNAKNYFKIKGCRIDENEDIFVSLEAVMTKAEGSYSLSNVQFSYKDAKTIIFDDFNGLAVFDDDDDKEGPNTTYGLFGIATDLNVTGSSGMTLTWGETGNTKTSNNIICLKDNAGEIYYMIYDNTNKIMYYAPNAVLTSTSNTSNESKNVNTCSGNFGIAEFKKLFNNKTFEAYTQQVVEGKAENLEFVDAASGNINLSQTEYKKEFVFDGIDNSSTVKQIVNSYSVNPIDADNQEVTLTLNEKALAGNFNTKYIGYYDPASDPLFSYDGNGNYNFNTSYKYVAATGSTFESFEIVRSTNNAITLIISKTVDLDEFVSVINSNSKVAPVIKLADNEQIGATKMQNIGDDYQLTTSVYTNVQSGQFDNSDYQTDTDGNVVLSNTTGNTLYNFAGVQVYENYSAFKFKYGVKIDAKLIGKNGEEGKGNIKITQNTDTLASTNDTIFDADGLTVQYSGLMTGNITIEANTSAKIKSNLPESATTVNIVFQDKDREYYYASYENGESLVLYLLKYYLKNEDDSYTEISVQEVEKEEPEEDEYYSLKINGIELTYNKNKKLLTLVSEELEEGESATYEAQLTTSGNDVTLDVKYKDFNEDGNDIGTTRTITYEFNLTKVLMFETLASIFDASYIDTSVLRPVKSVTLGDKEIVSQYTDSDTITNILDANYSVEIKEAQKDFFFGGIATSSEYLGIKDQKVILKYINFSDRENGSLKVVDTYENYDIGGGDQTPGNISVSDNGAIIYNIIMTQDINVKISSNIGPQNVNISGNGHFLNIVNKNSYMYSDQGTDQGTGQGTGQGTDQEKFTKDVKILNSVSRDSASKNTAFLTNSSKFVNVSLYGSLSGDETLNILTKDTEFNGVDNFVSVSAYGNGNSINFIGKSESATQSENANPSNCNNYGAWFAGNGAHGKSYGSGEKQGNGLGSNGGSIDFNGANKGLLRVGAGGNNGSTSPSENAADYCVLTKTTFENLTIYLASVKKPIGDRAESGQCTENKDIFGNNDGELSVQKRGAFGVVGLITYGNVNGLKKTRLALAVGGSYQTFYSFIETTSASKDENYMEKVYCDKVNYFKESIHGPVIGGIGSWHGTVYYKSFTKQDQLKGVFSNKTFDPIKLR